jgi:hypothetical protein
LNEKNNSYANIYLKQNTYQMILSYNPEYDARTGFEKVAEWYYENLKG